MVTHLMDSPRQAKVTSQGQGSPTKPSKEQEDRAVEATCNVGPKCIQEMGLEAKLPAVSLPGPC